MQKCKIELDENGTKAAAATAIGMSNITSFEEKPKKNIELTLDRPFVIIHGENGYYRVS